MRAIKFRGKSKLTGLFLEGNFLTDQDGETYIVWYNCHKKECLTSVYPKTIGQFTGLYDANGKEIYEGDILEEFSREEYAKATKIPSQKLTDLPTIGGRLVSVIYDAPNFIFSPNAYGYVFLNNPHLFRVMGNIYDNNDLIK